MRILRLLLFPFSLLYGGAVFLRNRLFDWEILKSERGVLPTIVIGNLSVGGTGKTPHTEYLIDHLAGRGIQLAVLSRGYGRKTSGYTPANEFATAHTIGDEPFQIHQKFPNIPLSVCEDRLFGVQKLKETTSAKLVILDDAFQHRRLKGDISILLTTYQKPFWKDFPLPTGNLRDNRREKQRADFIFITKCPENLSTEEMNRLTRKVQPKENQKVFFSSLTYGKPIQIHGPSVDLEIIENVLGLSGIAAPQGFKEYLSENYPLRNFKSFPDHYIFSQSDLRYLADECNKFGLPKTAILTTEKDAMRLKAMANLPQIPIFYIPIQVRMLNGKEDLINSLVRVGFK